MHSVLFARVYYVIHTFNYVNTANGFVIGHERGELYDRYADMYRAYERTLSVATQWTVI